MDFLPNRPVGSRLVPKANRDAIVAIMENHYCRHPLLFEGISDRKFEQSDHLFNFVLVLTGGRTFPANEFANYATRIHYGSTFEVYSYCQRNNLPDAWAYLWRNWYTGEKWKLWSRSSRLEIPTGKTTMLVESHWRVLKRNHLYHHNRPRLDLLCFVIISNYCADLAHTYQQKVVLRRDLFAWESEFVKEWNALHRRSIDVPRHHYLTNYEQW
ncbi:hypothetical protein, partial, partial [Absidia glauca]